MMQTFESEGKFLLLQYSQKLILKINNHVITKNIENKPKQRDFLETTFCYSDRNK